MPDRYSSIRVTRNFNLTRNHTYYKVNRGAKTVGLLGMWRLNPNKREKSMAQSFNALICFKQAFTSVANSLESKNETIYFGPRNGVHIINLEKTVPMFNEALAELTRIASNNGKILFVGTKRAYLRQLKQQH